MNERDKVKIGISIGTFWNKAEFKTPIDKPEYAICEANRIIRENFDPHFTMFFTNKQTRKARSRRRY